MKKRIILIVLAVALVIGAVAGSVAYAVTDPVNDVDFEYHNVWSYTPPGDIFSNGPVAGSKSWWANVDNRHDTGDPITGLQLRLDSDLILDWNQ